MKSFVIGNADDGRALSRFMLKRAPALNMGEAMRLIRNRRIRLNGRQLRRDAALHAGDTVELYIDDALFEPVKRENRLLRGFRHRLDIAYEDKNLIIVNKRAGMRVHPDDDEKVDTLITHIQAYLYQKGEYDGFSDPPALCNRIDRFTGGLVIAAKNRESLLIIDSKIRNREIEKYYLALCEGRTDPPEGELVNWIEKTGRRVNVLDRPKEGAAKAVTKYRLLEERDGLSLVECELKTGRTHQIRAQFARFGHPLAGDGQYGRKDTGYSFQQLYSYKLVFAFTTDAGTLNYLKGMTVTAPRLNRGFGALERSKIKNGDPFSE